MSDQVTRAAVIRAAHRWLDTPYQHQASQRGAGTDCLGLIRGVWRDLYGFEPEKPPAYTPDWAEQNGEETLLNAARRCLIAMPNSKAVAGDVVVFRMQNVAPCKHIGILMTPQTFIHAYWGKAVVQSYLVPYWQRRWAYSFAFPSLNSKPSSSYYPRDLS